jgi:hypothetical protein
VLRVIAYGVGGAIVGWIAAALGTLILAVIAGILEATEIRILIVLAVLIALVIPILPSIVVGSLIKIGGASSKLSSKALGWTAAGITIVFVAVPLLMITQDGLPTTLMTSALDLPNWVGTAFTGYTVIAALLSPALAYALSADLPIGGNGPPAATPSN